MHIPALLSTPQIQLELTRNEGLRALQAGQRVQAVVSSTAENNLMKLKIGNGEVSAHTNLRLAVGQQLAMEVVQGGRQPVLKILPQPKVENVLAQYVKSSLPNQKPLSQLMSLLVVRLNPAPQAPIPTPAPTLSPAPAATTTPVQTIAPQSLLQTQTQNLVTGRQQQATLQPNSSNNVQNSNAPIATQTEAPPAPASVNHPAVTQLSSDAPQSANTTAKVMLASQPNQAAMEVFASSPAIQAPAATLPAIQSSIAQMPAEIQSLVKNLLRHVELDLTKPLAPQVKKLLDNSGLFLEAKLAAGQVPTQDIKADLLKLLNFLQPLTGKPEKAGHLPVEALAGQQKLALELADQAESALAQIQTRQLSSLRTEPGSLPEWRMEVPLQWQDQAHDLSLVIHQESQGTTDFESAFSARLEFNFPELGPLAVNIQLRGKDVSCLFNANNLLTSQRIENEMARFENALRRVELNPGNLDCRHTPGATRQLAQPPFRFPLLDEQA